MIEEKNDSVHKIRPAARLIYTIGSDLIGDCHAALVELVKNSYDADATLVDINFNFTKVDKEDAIVITIKDNGHGMSYSTITNKWLVPATDDKLKRKSSPKLNRLFQGRKGIGRFASSILGQEMTLTSIDDKGERTILVIDWRLFKTDDFLESVELLMERKKTNDPSGTVIEIVAKKELNDDKISTWSRTAIENLVTELRKLVPPIDKFNNDDFQVTLSFVNSPYDDFNGSFTIEPFPLIDLYDYRISGTIDNKGNANLIFENNLNPTAKQLENIVTHFQIGAGASYCGTIGIDYRVFDREPEAIENLIDKGLIDPISQRYMGKNEARRALNEIYGVNIYKNFFRVRPYGNSGVDWLDLDKDRIQNFSLRISNNQIVGFITIQPEEISNLQEKSARDGLKENEHYLGLKELAKKALAELEIRRLIIRKKSKKSREERSTVQSNLNKLFSLNESKKLITARLTQLNFSQDDINEIVRILEKEEEKKQSLKEELEKTIAIYQGQATLGKIVNIILHEGRKPIQFFISETRNIEKYVNHYANSENDSLLNDLSKSIGGFKINSNIISGLFKKINPLARQSRGNKSNFEIYTAINDSFQIFSSTIKDTNIDISINCDPSLKIYGWREDLITSLTNLIENSLYWLNLAPINHKKIIINVSDSSESILIDYKDNGPGLSDSEIESDVIFEPGYSKKLNGTGLGLAIAGEAIERLNGKLKANKFDKGAYFQIEINK